MEDTADILWGNVEVACISSTLFALAEFSHMTHTQLQGDLGNVVCVNASPISAEEVLNSSSPYTKNIKKGGLNSSIIFTIDLLNNHTSHLKPQFPHLSDGYVNSFLIAAQWPDVREVEC